MAETTGDDWQQIKAATRHGTQAQGQASDGTGTSGNLPKFNADGSLTDSGVAASAIGTSLFLVFGYLLGQPTASQIVLAADIPANLSTVSFPGNFSNSVGKCGTNPTSTATYAIKQNGSSIGTMVISTSGVFTFTTTSGTAKAFAASDELTVVAPGSPDATLSDVRFTLAGTR